MTNDNRTNYGQLSKECLGVSSKVVTHAQNNMHVLFYDIEGQMIGDIKQVAEQFDNYFIFQSSPFNFHIVVPLIMSKSKVIDHKKECEIDDKQHLKVGSNRDSWVLRISGKGEKSAPDLVEYEINGRTPNVTFSKPHLDLIKESYNLNFEVPERKTIGTGLKIEQYWTY